MAGATRRTFKVANSTTVAPSSAPRVVGVAPSSAPRVVGVVASNIQELLDKACGHFGRTCSQLKLCDAAGTEVVKEEHLALLEEVQVTMMHKQDVVARPSPLEEMGPRPSSMEEVVMVMRPTW